MKHPQPAVDRLRKICCPVQHNLTNRKGHKNKRPHSVNPHNVAASTLFIGCAIASLVCLLIQGKIYFKNVDRNDQFRSLEDFVRHPGVESAARRNILEKDQAIGATLYHNLNEIQSPDGRTNTNLKHKEGTSSSSGDLDKGRQLFPPRVFYWNSAPDYVPAKLHLLPDSAESSDQLQQKKPVANQADDKSLGEILDTKSEANLTASNPEMDDEEEDSAIEDKEAMKGDDDDNVQRNDEQSECIPMARWQTSVPINCNSLHEVDLVASVINAAGPVTRRGIASASSLNVRLHRLPHSHPSWNESQLAFLGQGWFREAWKLDQQLPHKKRHGNDESNDNGVTVILKMLRPERDFTREFYELHRRDAVAMEQLTHSKYVLNVYGYCGQSALNEYASFRIPELNSLEKFDRQLRGKNFPRMNRMKLRLAVAVATGLAHVHELPADIVGDSRPSMVHYDLNPRNIAIVDGAMPKLNDFNTARYLMYNPRTKQTCKALSNLHEPWWRAPEEVSLNQSSPFVVTEKSDVYSLGNLLFHILTTHSPRGKMKDYRMESVREDVLRGISPHLPEEFASSKDPAVVAFRQAMDMCFAYDPRDRASAREVANVLFDALLEISQTEEKDEEGDEQNKHRKKPPKKRAS
jgi:serine/threonine protein kinase